MNEYVILLTYILVNIILLASISPLVDGYFTELDETESILTILREIIQQIITISIIWFLIDKYILIKVKVYLRIHNNELLNKVRDIVVGVILVGLQMNLIRKLEYIGKRHPLIPKEYVNII